MTCRVMFMAAILGAMLTITACEEKPAAPATPSSPPAPAQTPTLPRVDLADLQTLIRETAAQRKVLVIDFWATWCAPCVELFPGLHAAMQRMGPDVRAITVTLDAPESEAQAIRFLQANHAMHDAYLLEPDSDAQIAVVQGLGRTWQDLVVPAILVYDRNGQLAGEFLDGQLPPITAKVNELIAQP